MSTFTDSKEFNIFFAGVLGISNTHNQEMGYTISYKFSYTEGKRYVKIIRSDMDGSQKSVHCFVDKTNGNVLKAAGWSAPAKHARGNVYKDDNGLNCMGAHGAAYLRG